MSNLIHFSILTKVTNASVLHNTFINYIHKYTLFTQFQTITIQNQRSRRVRSYNDSIRITNTFIASSIAISSLFLSWLALSVNSTQSKIFLYRMTTSYFITKAECWQPRRHVVPFFRTHTRTELKRAIGLAVNFFPFWNLRVYACKTCFSIASA